MDHIVILYAKQDRACAATLANDLSEKGYKVWWDIETLSLEQLQSTLEQKVGQSNCVITLWSEHSAQSAWVKAESNYARRRNALISVRIDDVKIPTAFQTLPLSNYCRWRGRKSTSGFDEIIGRVAFRVGQPPIPLTAGHYRDRVEVSTIDQVLMLDEKDPVWVIYAVWRAMACVIIAIILLSIWGAEYYPDETWKIWSFLTTPLKFSTSP